MAGNVIRQDVIQVSFDIIDDGLAQVTKGLDSLKATTRSLAGGELGKLKTSMGGVNSEAAKLGAALKKVGGIDNLDNATGDLNRLNKKIEVQQQLCDALSKEHKEVSAAFGETSKKALQLKKSLLNQEDSLAKMQKESKSLSSAIDTVKNSANGVDDSLGEAKNEANKFKFALEDAADTKFNGLTNGLKKVVSTLGRGVVKAAKFAAAGIAAVGVGVGALVGKSVTAYADYEQLIGGVDTLFKGASLTVQDYAQTAYKTAGLSANDYMETVTGFSASLIQSLGGDTKKAAEYAHTAITDMSDNANKMGTSMESLQYAYQGFAKQNYTICQESAA